LGKEGVEGASEPVIVEAVGGDVPKVFGPSALGPGGDVDESGGLAESGCEQKAEDAPVRESALWIGRQMSIDDGRYVEALE
jgi:hypothetical protein